MAPMQAIEEALQLRERLELAKAEEAEAQRRAHHLRAIGSRGDYLEAMRDVDANHDHVARLQRELSWRQGG